MPYLNRTFNSYLKSGQLPMQIITSLALIFVFANAIRNFLLCLLYGGCQCTCY